MAQCTPVNTSNFSLFLSFVTGNVPKFQNRAHVSLANLTATRGKKRRKKEEEEIKRRKSKQELSRGGRKLRTAGRNADDQHVPRQLPLRQKRTLSLRSRGPGRSLSVQRTHGSLRLRTGAPLPVDRAKGGRNDRQPPFHGPAPFRGLLAIRVREHYACLYLWVYLLRWQHLA